MTRAQELRKLLLRVEAGLEDHVPVENVSGQIIRILAERTGNYAVCEQILDEHYERHERKEANNGTHED